MIENISDKIIENDMKLVNKLKSKYDSLDDEKCVLIDIKEIHLIAKYTGDDIKNEKLKISISSLDKHYENIKLEFDEFFKWWRLKMILING